MHKRPQIALSVGAAVGVMISVTKDLPAAEGRSVVRGESTPSRGTILVVDDILEVRATYRTLLKAAGWRVYEAADGREALETIERERIDALLLDVFMPNMNGIEVLIVSRDKLLNTAIISISGADSLFGRDMLNAALKFGADAAISKSVPISELIKAVEVCVAARPKNSNT